MRKKQVALVALTFAILIFTIKLFAYFISNSVALLSDALESIVNISASGLMYFSVCVSERAPDSGHKYGHQKIEDISSLLEGLFIVIAALFIIIAAVERLFEPINLLELNLAIVMSIMATALNAGLSLFLGSKAKEIGSSALEGDAKHLLSDVISSIGVWIGLFITQLTGLDFIDSIMGLIVAVIIVRMGGGLIVKASNRLMDQSCAKEEKMIMETLKDHQFHFMDFHDLRTRRSGNQVFAELHLSIDGSLSVKEAHDLTDHLEEELKEKLPTINITIHVEPPQK